MPAFSCTDFEIAIEQRLHGALPPGEAAALDEHLAGCAGCTAYVASASSSQRALVEVSRAAAGGADWQAATARFQGTLRARRQRMALGVVLLLVMAPFMVWVSVPNAEDRLPSLVSSFLTGGGILAAAALRTGLASRRLARLLESGRGEDVLELSRAYLRGRVRVMRWTRGLALPPLAMLVAFATVPSLAQGAHGWVGFAVAAAIVSAGWLRLQLRDLPRAMRELEELGSERAR
jgi:hypothetical protein